MGINFIHTGRLHGKSIVINKIPFLSYFGKRGKIIILFLLIVTLITLVGMTFNAYKDNERIVYIKDIVLVLLLVSALAFIQFYFFQNIMKPIKNFHGKLKKLSFSENRNTPDKESASAEEIDVLVDRK